MHMLLVTVYRIRYNNVNGSTLPIINGSFPGRTGEPAVISLKFHSPCNIIQLEKIRVKSFSGSNFIQL